MVEGELGEHAAYYEGSASVNMTVTLIMARYGTYGGESHALLVFKVSSQYPEQKSSRLQAATIAITFSGANGEFDPPSQCPTISEIAPKECRSMEPTLTQHQQQVGANLALSPTPGFSVGASASQSTTHQTSSYTHIQGNFTSSNRKLRRANISNHAEFTLKENASNKGGIPRTFFSTLLVKLPAGGGGFRAMVEISAHQSVFDKIYRMVSHREQDDPAFLLFDSAHPELGPPHLAKIVEPLNDFNDVDLNKLVSLPSIVTLPPGY